MLRRKNKAILKSLQIYLNFTQLGLGLGINNMWKIALNCIFRLFLLTICAASGQNIEKVFIIIV